MTNSGTRPTIDKARTIVRVIVGLVLLVSAFAKGANFDSLELYIFSFGWFSLGLSFWLARLLVATEVVLGLALILNLHRRASTWCSLGLVGLFSAFLGYALLVGRGDNCHCLGEWVEMNPVESLLKNVVLLAALCFILPQRGGLHLRSWIAPLGAAVITLATFVLSPPDNINPHLNYDRVLNSAMFDTLPHNEGRRIVCLYSTECHYCQLASNKIASLVRRHNLENQVEVWFAEPHENADQHIAEFYEQTSSPAFRYSTLPIKEFLVLTSGAMPIVLLVDGDSVAHEYNYRTIDEREICNFFGK